MDWKDHYSFICHIHHQICEFNVIFHTTLHRYVPIQRNCRSYSHSKHFFPSSHPPKLQHQLKDDKSRRTLLDHVCIAVIRIMTSFTPITFQNGSQLGFEALGGYSLPPLLTVGIQVHHCSRATLSMTLGICWPQPHQEEFSKEYFSFYRHLGKDMHGEGMFCSSISMVSC